jgi:hypothetical protein
MDNAAPKDFFASELVVGLPVPLGDFDCVCVSIGTLAVPFGFVEPTAVDLDALSRLVEVPVADVSTLV